VVTGADAAALDAVIGAWLMDRASAAGDLADAGQGGDDKAALIPVRVDGKTVRGARNADGIQIHLLAALAGQRDVVAHAATGRGHGRIETRTIQLLDAPGDLPFPHVSQAYLIERHVTALDGTPLPDIAACRTSWT
jgi:hypothetical protein